MINEVYEFVSAMNLSEDDGLSHSKFIQNNGERNISENYDTAHVPEVLSPPILRNMQPGSQNSAMGAPDDNDTPMVDPNAQAPRRKFVNEGKSKKFFWETLFKFWTQEKCKT